MTRNTSCAKSIGMYINMTFLENPFLIYRIPYGVGHTVWCSWITGLILLEIPSIWFRRFIHCTAKHSRILCHSREHVSTALNSSGGMLFITAFDAAWMQLLDHRDPAMVYLQDIWRFTALHTYSLFPVASSELKTDYGIFGIQ